MKLFQAEYLVHGHLQIVFLTKLLYFRNRAAKDKPDLAGNVVAAGFEVQQGEGRESAEMVKQLFCEKAGFRYLSGFDTENEFGGLFP